MTEKSLCPAGRYEAKIVNYGIGESKASKAPQVQILFEFQDDFGGLHQMTWFGHLGSEKAQEITMKALLTCGMKGNDVAALAEGYESGLLDAETPVTVVVEHEDYNGKTSAKIRWVNSASGGKFKNAMSKDDAKVKLGALNLKGAMMAAREATGIKEQKPATKPTFATEDIPF